MKLPVAVAVAAVALVAACGGHSTPKPVALPTPSPTASPTPSLPVVPNPLDGGRVARITRPVTYYDHPDGKPVGALGVKTELGGPQGVLIAGYAPGWLQLRLPVRPNTATGWVPADSVAVADDPWSIQVIRAAHTLVVRRSGVVTARYPVAIGTSRTPTPAGVFYVTDLILTGDPGGAFGPAALGLSGHSDVIKHFAGADGVLGIHGTNAQSSVGKSASHGCIRMHNADSLALMRTVQVGTPVVIS